MRLHIAIVTLGIAAVCSQTRAGDLGCKGNPHLIGRCYWVSATFGISADNADALWLDKSGRAVPIRNAFGSERSEPDNLLKALGQAQRKAGSLNVEIHGQFEVCPIPAEPNRYDLKRYVCINAAQHLSMVQP
jgi:hypothetical protein